MTENFTQNFGWIEIALFYGIAIGVCFWQWAKMRREVRESRAKRAEAEAREASEASESGDNAGEKAD